MNDNPHAPARPFRVAYLQLAPSAHTNACLRALVASGCEVLATLPPTLRDAPYDDTHAVEAITMVSVDAQYNSDRLAAELEAFDPDVLLIVSWHVKAYRACARALSGRTVRVLCMDNQWLWKPKQLLGVLTSRFYLRPIFDRAFLPGDRQRKFARLLGFPSTSIDVGFYSADTSAFDQLPLLSIDDDDRRAFVFIARLLPQKGVDALLDAYTRYRDAVDDPWPLIVAGTGPLRASFEGVPGVELTGFVQPRDVPGLLTRASALVLPSRFEPWGVVVHEATASGLLVVTTDRVGAADDLVTHLDNGFIGAAGSADDLLEGLLWVHRLDPSQLATKSARSRQRASAFSPSRWADTVRSMRGDVHQAVLDSGRG